MTHSFRFHFHAFAVFFGSAFLACLTWLTPAKAAEQDAGDIEIIRAFQERYYASTGAYVYWGAKLNGSPGDPYPSEGDYSQATLDSHIGSFIYDYLKRYTSNTNRPLFYLSDEGGFLRQAYGAAVIADITLRTAGDGYEVAIYDRPFGSQPDPVTGLLSVSGLTPVLTHKFINPQAGPGPWPPGVGKVRYEKVHGTETEVHTFESEAQTGNGTSLTSLTHPGGHRKESSRTTWEVDAGNVRLNVDTETRHTYDAAGGVIGKEVRTYRWSTNGRVLDKGCDRQIM